MSEVTKSEDIPPEHTIPSVNNGVETPPLTPPPLTPPIEKFDELLTPQERHARHEYYKSIFDKYDTNKTGFIELKELREMLKSDDEIPRQIIRNVFNISDRNHDDRIDYDEFVGMIHDKKFKVLFGKYVDNYIRFILPRQKHHLVGATEVDGIYEDHYSCCPPPFAMVLFSAFELACFITDEWTQKNSTVSGSGVTAQLFIYDPTQRKEAWRFFTYMFVHIGSLHLIVNLLVQLLLGIPLEMVHKWWRVSIIYLCGVIAGSLCTSITDPTTFLAGASGGVYALMTAHIASIIMNWNEMTFPSVQLILFLVIACFDVGTAIYNRYWLDLEDHIGYAAHFAGALAGLFVGIWILKNFILSTKEKYLWWAALIIFVLAIGSMVIMNVFWSSHFLTTG